MPMYQEMVATGGHDDSPSLRLALLLGFVIIATAFVLALLFLIPGL
jgi:hypothetical protein